MARQLAARGVDRPLLEVCRGRSERLVEVAEPFLGSGNGVGRGWGTAGQGEAIEDRLGHVGCVDGGQEPHRPAAARPVCSILLPFK